MGLTDLVQWLTELRETVYLLGYQIIRKDIKRYKWRAICIDTQAARSRRVLTTEASVSMEPGGTTLPARERSLLCPLGKLSWASFWVFNGGSLSKHNWLNLGHWRLIQSPTLSSLDVCVRRGTPKIFNHSLVVQWLKFHAAPCRVPGLIPGPRN